MFQGKHKLFFDTNMVYHYPQVWNLHAKHFIFQLTKAEKHQTNVPHRPSVDGWIDKEGTMDGLII